MRDQVETEVERLLDAIESQSIPAAAASKRITQRHGELEQLNAEIERLTAEQAVAKLDRSVMEEVMAKLLSSVEVLDQLTPEEERAILSSFIDKIVVAPTVEEIEVHFNFTELLAQGGMARSRMAQNGQKETPSEKSDGVSHAVAFGDPEET